MAHVLYGRGKLNVSTPKEVRVIAPSSSPPLQEPDDAIRKSLASPIQAPPLVEIARSRDPREGAVIVVSDITRPVPNKPILEGVLSTLQDSGYDESSITILVATGMHRPTTDEEKAEMLGEEIPRRFRIVDHKADRRDELVELPEPTSAGSRVLVNKLYMQAGLKILTGFIEPHFMAGYSGGRKSICPGISNLETIQKFHGPGFLEDPGANFGILDGNPCHRESLDVARQAGADFVVNVAIDTDKRILGVYAGDLEAAHEAGVADVERMVGVDVDDQYDIVITCGGGYPLDSTYYQAVKGMCFALPFLKEGGILVEASECCEGVGSDIYEQLMVRFSGEWEHFLETIRQSDDVIKDQWEFEVQCRVLRHTGVERLIFLTDGIETERLAHFCVTPAQRLVGEGDSQDVMDRLVKYLHAEHPDASWAVVPVGPYLLPRVGAMATI